MFHKFAAEALLFISNLLQLPQWLTTMLSEVSYTRHPTSVL